MFVYKKIRRKLNSFLPKEECFVWRKRFCNIKGRWVDGEYVVSCDRRVKKVLSFWRNLTAAVGWCNVKRAYMQGIRRLHVIVLYVGLHWFSWIDGRNLVWILDKWSFGVESNCGLTILTPLCNFPTYPMTLVSISKTLFGWGDLNSCFGVTTSQFSSSFFDREKDATPCSILSRIDFVT